MNTVEKILERTQFTEEIDGVEFTLRLITAEVAARVLGAKALGLVKASGGVPKELSEDAIMSTVTKYLEACMVSPKIGEVSDPETDTISMDDLGEFAGKILMIVFRKSGFEGVGNFNGSSEDTGEGT